MSPLTKQLSLEETGKADRRTAGIIRAMHYPLCPAALSLPFRSCVPYSTSFSALHGLWWFLFLIPIFLCGVARMNRSWRQKAKRGPVMKPAVSNFQFLLRFSVEEDPSMSPISPLHDGIYPCHQDHQPAAFTNISAYCKGIWHLRIKIPQAFAFDQSQPRPPKRFFRPSSDFLLPKVNRLMIPWVSLFHKRHHCKAPVCVSPSW